MVVTPAPPQAKSARSSNFVYLQGDTLASVELLEDLIDDFDTIFDEAVEEVVIIARREAREAALRDPKWSDYADLIDVEFTGDEFHYVLVGDDERVREAMRLEFGMPGSSPHSLLRKQAASTERDHSLALTELIEAEASVA